MGPQGVWQAWEGEVSRVLSTVGIWQRRALAMFSLGVASAKHCGLARAAAVVPGLAVVPSTTRRFERLLSSEGALDAITRPGGVLDRLLQEGGLLDRLLSEDGFVEKLTSDGGTLDQLVALGQTLERMQPRVTELLALIPALHESVDTLNRAVEPLSDLANRIPGGRRRSALEA